MATIRFFRDSNSFFEGLIEKINHAQNFIILEYYILDFESKIGKKILEALKNADDRGVQVMLHLDGVGSRQWLMRDSPPCIFKNGEIKIFNPIPWPFSRFLASQIPKMGKFLKYWSRINHRNHKKLAIVDGNYAFVGSMNIHDFAFQWVECGVMCEREVVYVLLDTYLQLKKQSLILQRGEVHSDFFKTVLKIGSDSDAEEVLFQKTRNHRALFRRRHKKAFLQAQSHITLVTPYFVPTLWLMKSLIQACQRGVEVTLILSKSPDHRFMNWLADKYLYPLVDSGVKVFKAEPMVHAKIVMADSWVHLGSCNLNQRSLHLDMELNVQVRGKEKQDQVQNFVNDLSKKSDRVTLNKLNQRPLFEKVMGTLLYIFRTFL